MEPEVRQLDTLPNLTTLYPKAALAALTRSGEATELPAVEYERPGVTVDPAHLAEYARVCGFRLGDELPATYPHVLAFPMAVLLMTDPAFPFALPGLVHVANRITQHRPLHVDERCTLRVRAEGLRPHPKGQQFDVVSEAHPPGEDTVWTSRSTYLRRGSGGSGESGSGRAGGAESRQLEEFPTPAMFWSVPADIGRRYGAVSGDRNPIHMHPLAAKAFGFPRMIAHGMWSKARCLAAYEGRVPAAFAVDVSFRKPVLLPAKVDFGSRPDGAGGTEFALRNTKKERTHLTGVLTAL